MKRKPSLKTIFIIVLALVYIFLSLTKTKSNNTFFSENEKKQLSKITITAKCVKVFDGDTIEARILSDNINNLAQTEKIHFIGIKTPEFNKKKNGDNEYFAQEAYEFTKNELENRYIKLKFDDITSMRDKDNRLLCYVYVDDFLFNKILLETGYARYFDKLKFNNEKMILFAKAENYARLNRMGMWNHGK